MGFSSNSLFLISLILINHISPTPAITAQPDKAAKSPAPPPHPARSRSGAGFLIDRSVAVTIAILTTISVASILLLYINHCKNNESYETHTHGIAEGKSGTNSKAIIESLPFFRFSLLRGHRPGLECAVCLSRFELDEFLRLLPKCKHAFHVECVDTWLDSRSTCPLCRVQVDPEDTLLDHDQEFANPRVSGRHSSVGEKLSCIVEDQGGSGNSRVSLDGWDSRRKKRISVYENQWLDPRSKSLGRLNSTTRTEF